MIPCLLKGLKHVASSTLQIELVGKGLLLQCSTRAFTPPRVTDLRYGHPLNWYHSAIVLSLHLSASKEVQVLGVEQ